MPRMNRSRWTAPLHFAKSAAACAALGAVLLAAGSGAPAHAGELQDLFKKVNPAVVEVRTVERQISPTAPGKYTSVGGLGSGVLITDDGHVLTAAHVVQVSDAIEVEFANGDVVSAEIIASQPAADVACLKLARVPQGAVVAPLGDSDLAEPGDDVFVIGAPYGISHTLTVGHISGRHEPDIMYSGLELAELLQTDAAINQGNSGGPMFNMAGEVIGIVSHSISQSGGFEGLGFVIASNTAKKLLLQEPQFWSGMEGQVVRGTLAEIFNVPPPGTGVLVQRVAKDSPAEKLGLRAGKAIIVVDDQPILAGGDIILKVQAIPVGQRTSIEAVRKAMQRLQPGDTLTLDIWRAGEVITLQQEITQDFFRR